MPNIIDASLFFNVFECLIYNSSDVLGFIEDHAAKPLLLYGTFGHADGTLYGVVFRTKSYKVRYLRRMS